MTNRSRSAALCAGLALFAGPATAAPSAAPRATAHPSAIVAPGALLAERARDLYSARARRVVRTYLQLRLLELREAELSRVRAVIEGNLGLNELFSPAPTQASGPPLDKSSRGRNDTPGASR